MPKTHPKPGPQWEGFGWAPSPRNDLSFHPTDDAPGHPLGLSHGADSDDGAYNPLKIETLGSFLFKS